ncbi:MAG TPA: hypothetical protein VEG61_08860, partial [Candidatus Dormibacteraeota bacterium]|nr:hypothetical protein [Candidatus Dormibacteraeota bacterium]
WSQPHVSAEFTIPEAQHVLAVSESLRRSMRLSKYSSIFFIRITEGKWRVLIAGAMLNDHD